MSQLIPAFDIRNDGRVILCIALACFSGLACGQDSFGNDAYTERLADMAVEFEMVFVPGGEVALKAMETDPNDVARIRRHDKEYFATLSPFWIGKYEMTFGVGKYWALPSKEFGERFKDVSARTKEAYRLCPRLSGISGNAAEVDDDCAFVSLSHFGAKRFCHWLSMVTGRFYRLPTEAEWEYACRAGSRATYPWGDDASQLDRYVARNQVLIWDFGKTGTRQANSWGIHDMLGNVEEWVGDGFHEGYCAFDAQPRLKDPIAWPLGQLEPQNEPFRIRVATELARSEERLPTGNWHSARAELPLSVERHAQLRGQVRDKGQLVALGSGVSRGGSTFFETSPTPEHFACALRNRPSETRQTTTIEPMADNSLYWNEGDIRDSVGFRVVRPTKVPSAEIQLWHWGIYENHAFWQSYTIPQE